MMIKKKGLLMTWGVAVAAVGAVACGGSATAPSRASATPTPTPTPTPAPPAAVALLRPEASAVIPQNNAESGCAFSASAGGGVVIQFDWSDVAPAGGLSGYEILVQRHGATAPLVSASTATSEHLYRLCGSFVADANLEGWTWQVRAADRVGQFGPWQTATFSFAPCRIGRRPCGT